MTARVVQNQETCGCRTTGQTQSESEGPSKAGLAHPTQDKAKEIASANKCKDQRHLVTYPVADLVIPVQGQPGADGNNLPEKLIALICHVVATESWSDVGGAATLQYYPLGLSLVINQTQAVHEQISALLTALRGLQDVEIAVETSIFAVSPEMAQVFRELGRLPGQKRKRSAAIRQCAVLDDKQAASWMGILQTRRTSTVMRAPKITVFNGQAIDLRIGDEVEGVPVGLLAKILPVVSADGKSVRLHIYLTDTAVVGKCGWRTYVETLTLNKVAVLPDGGTIVYRLGRRVVEGKDETTGPAFLSETPYLSTRLFGLPSVHGEERDVFVLVKASVIVNVEQETTYSGGLPPKPR